MGKAGGKKQFFDDGERDISKEQLVETVQKLLRTGAELDFLLKLEQKGLERLVAAGQGGSGGEVVTLEGGKFRHSII